MAESSVYANDYIACAKRLVQVLDDLRLLNDRFTQDGTLLDSYLSSAGKRSDLNANGIEFTNARAAVVQVLFTYDSGSPTQKSYIFKLL